MQQLIENDTHRPQVRLEGVLSDRNDFRGHIVVGPANTLAGVLIAAVAGPPEIAKLDIKIGVEQKVLGLEIAMHNLVLVEVLHAQGSLVKEPKGELLGQTGVRIYVKIERVVLGELDEHVDHVLHLQEVHKPDNVLVVE